MFSGIEQQHKARLWLNADFDPDFHILRRLDRDFGELMPTVKLGPAFLQHPAHIPIRQKLHSWGLKTALDTKHKHNPDQMGPLVQRDARSGYKYTTVASAVGVEGLMSAAKAQKGIRVVAEITPGDADLIRLEVGKLKSANEELEPENRITMGMSNVNDLELLKNLGLITVVTGIRYPGDAHHNDQPYTAPPIEALERGADILSIGRTIMAADDRLYAFRRVLEDIASVEYNEELLATY